MRGNICVTITGMIEIRGYVDENGSKRFAQWLEALDAAAAAKVTIALTRMEQGNLSRTKGAWVRRF